MATLPMYDPSVPKRWYDSFGEKEWTRLSGNPLGELLFHVHMDVFRCYVNRESSVLELGAGAGAFSKELVMLAGKLVVSDLSETQLAINKSKMAALGLAARIGDFLLLDITDLSHVPADEYDTVICVGGALNYTFDKEGLAIREMLRVTKPGGVLIVGAISLISSLLLFLPAVADEKKQFGLNATKWLMDTGMQDAAHYPVASRHYLHMMRSRDLDGLFERADVEILEKRAAGLFAIAGVDALNQARADEELWNLILSKELEFSKNPACLDCGANIIYVVRKASIK